MKTDESQDTIIMNFGKFFVIVIGAYPEISVFSVSDTCIIE